MENKQNAVNPGEADEQNGEAENEKANYTSMPTEKPASNNDDEDAIAGDLAGNASGNEETED